jgi:hypothetical protein
MTELKKWTQYPDRMLAMRPPRSWPTQTRLRGTNEDEYEIYLTFADDGNGGDTTRNGAPLKSFDEWMNS